MELVAMHAGVDLAKSVDYTALTLAEMWRRPRADAPPPRPPYRAEDVAQETLYRVQHIERFPHGMPWKAQPAAVAALLSAVQAQLLVQYVIRKPWDVIFGATG